MTQTKEQRKEYQRQWRKNNPDKVRANSRRWRKNNPDKVREYNQTWRENNPDKVKGYAANYRKNNPEKVRDHSIRKSWGFGADRYDSLIAEFGGKCECCGTTEDLRLDHCHETGRIRGVLCNTHNLGLGKIGDTIEDVRALLHYMEEQASREHDYYVTGGKFGREVHRKPRKA